MERLQKFLARSGVASRRKAEQLILDGRVKVNGKAVRKLGTRIHPGRDRVEVEGKQVRPEKLVYLLMNKPPQVVSTVSDPQGRPTVLSLLPRSYRKERLFPVGRLDFQSEGALLLTNDGSLTHALLHPSFHVPKIYLARMRGQVSVETLERMREGVELEDGLTQPVEAKIRNRTQNATWVEIQAREGRNRLIRRMGDALGHPVLRLIRVSFAGLEVESMAAGEIRVLNPKEIARLRGLATPKNAGDQRGHAEQPKAETDVEDQRTRRTAQVRNRSRRPKGTPER